MGENALMDFDLRVYLSVYLLRTFHEQRFLHILYYSSRIEQRDIFGGVH